MYNPLDHTINRGDNMTEITKTENPPRKVKHIRLNGREFSPKDFVIPFDTPQGKRIYQALAALLSKTESK